MFMFWSKRTVLTRRLLKAKVRGEHETECEAQEEPLRINRSQTSPVKETSNEPTSPRRTTVGAGSPTAPMTATGKSGVEEAVQQQQQRVKGTRGTRTSSTVSRLHQGCCGGERDHDDDEDPGRLLRCKDLLKKLEENQLEMLLTVVESCGADLGSCVLVPRLNPADDDGSGQRSPQPHRHQQQYYRNHRRSHHHHHFHHLHRHHLRHHRKYLASLEDDDQQQCQQCYSDDDGTEDTRPERCRVPARATIDAIEPHVLCCQIWRWPDLTHTSELKRLPVCHSAKDPTHICCNPYHWSRLCKPESPPPPYCLIADRLRPEDRAPSEEDQPRSKNSSLLPLPGSLTTNGEGEMGQKEWCTLAYWELGGRVGRLYPVEPTTVNVFDSLHDGDGLCLATLAENHTSSPTVEKTRRKIGLGLMLSQEPDGVWAYNRSESPIFVNSPTLDDPESRTVLVYRVPPGFCLNIFDRAKIMPPSYGIRNVRCTNVGTGYSSGPVDVNSVRISFAKGWGPKYSRQEVTSCPCWLEVLLAPCR